MPYCHIAILQICYFLIFWNLYLSISNLFVTQSTIQIVIYRYRIQIFVFYVTHLNKFSCEGVHMFHQNFERIHGPRVWEAYLFGICQAVCVPLDVSLIYINVTHFLPYLIFRKWIILAQILHAVRKQDKFKKKKIGGTLMYTNPPSILK